MKWIFYVIVFIYMGYRAVYGAKIKTIESLSVDPVDYGKFGSHLIPGSAKSIPCVYSSKNQQIVWLDPTGKPVSPLKSNRIYTQRLQVQTLHDGRSPALVLTFSDAWVEDSGEYECRSGDLSEKVSLCVIDPLTFVDTPSEVSVDEGRSFTLTCEARGQPEPRLVWYRNEQIISDESDPTKYIVMTKFNSQGFEGQLTILSVDPKDAGSYTCEAIQEHADIADCSISKNWNITLNVNYAPVFDTDYVKLYLKYNESVDLECEPRAYPLPTYRWFSEVDDETLINYPPEKVKLSEDKAVTTITIIANAVSFGMKYVCRATNNFGFASKTFKILEAKKPRQPYVINVVNYTDTQIEVNVKWEDEILFPIEEIQVQSLVIEGKPKIPRESEWYAVEPQALVVNVMDDLNVNITIPGFEPDTNYWIRLRAVNELGKSPWAKAFMASTDKESENDGDDEELAEIEEAETDTPTEEDEENDEPRTDSMFYGIFFAGGILVVSFVCMVLIRLF